MAHRSSARQKLKLARRLLFLNFDIPLPPRGFLLNFVLLSSIRILWRTYIDRYQTNEQ